MKRPSIFAAALSALTLDDVIDLFGATNTLIDKLGDTWPELRDPEHRPDRVVVYDGQALSIDAAGGTAAARVRGED